MEPDVVSGPTGSTIRGLLRSPALGRLVAALFAFQTVEYGTWVAVLVYAYEATGPASVGLVAVAQLVPAALFAPLLARIGDRWDRATVLRVTYGALTLACLATGLAMLVELPPSVVYPLAIGLSVLTALPRPLHGSLLPALASDTTALTAGNGASATAEGLGALIGPLVAGLLLAVASPGIAILAAAGSVAISALLVPTVRGRVLATPKQDRPEADLEKETASAIGPTSGGHDLAPIALVVGLGAGVEGALDILTVILAIEQLGMGESGAGYLAAAIGLGGVAGGAATVALAGRPRLVGLFGMGAVFVGAAVLVLGLATGPLLALAVLAVAGGGLCLIDVVGRTLVQRIVPDDVLAGSLGRIEALRLAGMATGSFVVGPAIAVAGTTGMVLLTAVALPLAVALVWPRLRTVDARSVVPVAEIAQLRRLALFAPLPTPTVEWVARELDKLRVRSGARIIREGDIGDRWYLVVAGSLRVDRGGEPIRVLGPGDAFGEIALLHRVPRTASVTAETDAELLALDRDAFLTALTGSPDAARMAARVADGHLAADRRRGV
jgi:MFS family permease